MLRRLTISSPSNGTETDLCGPIPIAHELWALWAAGLVEPPLASPPEAGTGTSIILPARPSIEIDPRRRIEEIPDENIDNLIPALARSTAISIVQLQENLEGRHLVPFVEGLSNPISELDLAEDPIADVVRPKVRYLLYHVTIR